MEVDVFEEMMNRPSPTHAQNIRICHACLPYKYRHLMEEDIQEDAYILQIDVLVLKAGQAG